MIISYNEMVIFFLKYRKYKENQPDVSKDGCPKDLYPSALPEFSLLHILSVVSVSSILVLNIS